MSYLVRNAKRALLDTFEARNTIERGPCLQTDRNRTLEFSTSEVLHAFCEVNGIELDWANEYGEPGYSTEKGVLLTNWNRIPKSLADRLEAQGYACEYSDEWIVDTDHGSKAYRTSPDGHGWEPRVRASDGFYLTPDSDPQEWIDDALNEPSRPLPSWFDEGELEARGYRVTSEEHETGFHPHQTDDPSKIMAALTDKGFDVILQVSDRGQFATTWRVWARREAERELFLSDTRGVYIPRDFAQCVHREQVIGVSPEDWEVLEAGPDHEWYWETWQSVCDNAVITSKESGTVYTLDQNGDLWIIERGAEYNEQEDTYYVYP